MKRLFLTLSLLAASAVLYKCGQNEEPFELNPSYESKIESLEQMYASSFEHLNLQMPSFVNSRKGFTIDNKKFFNSTSDFLNDNYMTKGRINLKASDFDLDRFSSFPNGRTLNEDLEAQLLDAFGEQSGGMLLSLVEKLADTPNLDDIPDMVDDFYEEVIYGTLTEDEKTQLLSAGSAVKSLAVFFSDNRNLEQFKSAILPGGIDNNSSSITLADLANARTTFESGGCGVNWGNVWAGAVINGAFGLKTGCAGGLVAGPIGAASGCVGGAVMGFASGFLWGTVGGIGAELLRSCF